MEQKISCLPHRLADQPNDRICGAMIRSFTLNTSKLGQSINTINKHHSCCKPSSWVKIVGADRIYRLSPSEIDALWKVSKITAFHVFPGYLVRSSCSWEELESCRFDFFASFYREFQLDSHQVFQQGFALYKWCNRNACEKVNHCKVVPLISLSFH